MVLYCLILESVSVTFHLMYEQTVLIRSRLLSGKELPVRLTLCSLCIMYVCNLIFFPVLILSAGFEF